MLDRTDSRFPLGGVDGPGLNALFGYEFVR
jgi:hypothetical protein